MTMLSLAWQSARSRRYALLLTLGSIILSVALLLAVERLRHGARDSFTAALSGTDLIVGPRSHPVQLLLYSVFHIGETDAGMTWDSVERIGAHPAVAWTVPLTLGDSHRGFPVVATTTAYFDHYRHGGAQALTFSSGTRFNGLFDVVVGAEVARRLGYRLGDELTLSHGAGHAGHADHEDKPFTVVGILAATGTPVDRTLHIGLQAMEAIHLDWHGGAHVPGVSIGRAELHKFDLRPKQVTAVLVGLKQRAAVLRMQRIFGADDKEALSAVIPGVALQQLWDITGAAERVLRAVSLLVLVVALAGLGERRRELAILRAVGARPWQIFLLLVCEGLGLAIAGAAGGFALVEVASFALAPLALANWGLAIYASAPGLGEAWLLAAVVGAGLTASVVPGVRAYRLSLIDGLAPKV